MMLRRSGTNNSAMFAEIVPEQLRSAVYAFDRSFEGAVGATAAPLVGELTRWRFQSLIKGLVVLRCMCVLQAFVLEVNRWVGRLLARAFCHANTGDVLLSVICRLHCRRANKPPSNCIIL